MTQPGRAAVAWIVFSGALNVCAQISGGTDATVPDVYAINGQFSRIAMLRFKYETDLLDGLEKMVKTEKIGNAVILAGAGAVRNYSLHVVNTRSFPLDNLPLKRATTPADITSMNGYVINGQVHAHITMATAHGSVGGHLEHGTNVFSFALVTLGVLTDSVDLNRANDKNYR